MKKLIAFVILVIVAVAVKVYAADIKFSELDTLGETPAATDIFAITDASTGDTVSTTYLEVSTLSTDNFTTVTSLADGDLIPLADVSGDAKLNDKITKANLKLALDMDADDLTNTDTLADADNIPVSVTAGTSAVNDKITYANLKSILSFINVNRPKFSYGSTTTITIGGGGWRHKGSVDRIVYIDSAITHTITGAETSGWQYIYIDDSAVVTAATNILTASEVVNTPTTPTWSDAKKGWYNGDDLCVFAVYEDGSGDALEFFHDGGDYVLYADIIAESSGLKPSDTWGDVECASSVPSFSTKAGASFDVNYIDTDSLVVWRTNGQTGANGHAMGAVKSTGTRQVNDIIIFTDSNRVIEVKFVSATVNNTITTYINGWYLPTGM